MSVLSKSFSILGIGNQDVRTPIDLFTKLHNQFNFKLDPCDSIEYENWLGIPSYNLNRKENGLERPWYGNVFVNPPWNNIFPWIRKAETEIKGGTCQFVVFLVPSRTEVKWFHHLLDSKYLMNHTYLDKRVTFADHKNAFVIGISIFVLWKGVNNK